MNKENEIKRRRKAMGMTATDLAIAAMIQPSALCKYERGIPCNKQTAEKICNVLNCTPEDIFPGLVLRDW